MDETQRRKISAKEFLEKNSKLGLGIIGLFLFLLAIYVSFIFFYSAEPDNTNGITASTTESLTTEFLFPIFSEPDTSTSTEVDNSFLGNFGIGNQLIQNLDESDGGQKNDTSKIVQVENKPVLGYTTFLKNVSIKNFIKNKPKICDQKIEVVLEKEKQSPSVLALQNTLHGMEGYTDIPLTGILDQGTRDKLYVFQKRFGDIIYKKKSDTTPTRVIDKETAHFLNLLCDNDKENADDYVQIPTVRYVLKETRQIFDYDTNTKGKAEIEAKTATGTEDVTFSKDGNLVVFRRDLNGVIDSTFYNIKTRSITHLEPGITSLDFNENGLLVYGIQGVYGMSIKSFDYLTNSAKRVADIPLDEWNIFSISENEIGLYNKPTAFADGIFMILNTDTKKITHVAGPFLGLGVQKTDTKDLTILSNGSLGQTNTLLLNNRTRVLGELGLKTFAEKCSQTVFADGIFCAVPTNLSPNLIYPDDWYKQKFTSQDVIVYKSLMGTTTKIVSYLDNRPLSVVNLTVNKSGIFFVDENTLNLYSIELSQ
jgi:hypothetical protein